MIYLFVVIVFGGLLLALFRPELAEVIRESKANQKAKSLGIVLGTWWAPRKKGVRRMIKILTVMILIGQAVGFALFMYEEALQTVMFATWQAPGADRTALAASYRAILNAGWSTLYVAGWLNPLAWGPYQAYFRSAEEWYVNAYVLRGASKP